MTDRRRRRMVQFLFLAVAVASQANAGASATIVGEDAGNWPTSQVGYDLVVVLDTTSGMEQHYRYIANALATAFHEVEREQVLFRAGLLLFRDRKGQEDCDIEYLTRWVVDLTGDLHRVVAALRELEATRCASEEPAEAVYDALNRAIQDPRWRDGSFKSVLLIGDAPPHSPEDRAKNPLGFSVPAITQMADERNLRFLTVKIGLEGQEEFRALARGNSEAIRGRFRAVDSSSSASAAIAEILAQELDLLRKVNRMNHRSESRPGTYVGDTFHIFLSADLIP